MNRIFSDHNQGQKNLNIWNANILLHNQQVKEEIKRENIYFFLATTLSMQDLSSSTRDQNCVP